MTLKPIKELIPSGFSGKKVVLEVYKTDEDNFVPYRSGEENTTTTDETDEDTSKDDEESSEDTTETDDTGFTLHQGKILETYYYNEPYTIDWGKDYEGLSGEGKITMQFKKKDMKNIYKGVRCKLRITRFNHGKSEETKYEDAYLCFVTDIQYTPGVAEITLSSFEKLLEQQDKLTYTQMLRSKILEEVIKTAGLIPVVDPTGLPDEVIDWTSKSSSGDDSSGGDGSMTESEIWEIAKTWFYAHMGTNHEPEKAWSMFGKKKNHGGDCFDITAWLFKTLNDFAGVKARDICGHGNGSSGTHHVIQVYKNGNWEIPAEMSELTGNLHPTSAMKNGDYMVCRSPDNPDNYICCTYGNTC